MKQSKFRSLLGLTMATAILSSCSGLNGMKKNADDINFNVTPNPLETQAGAVNVSIDGVFPNKYFNKKVVLEATPVLKYATGETAYKKVTVQGQKIDDNNKVINYKNGGNFTYKDGIEYNKEMRVSELELHVKATKGKKTVNFDPITLAKGVLSTSELVMDNPRLIEGVVREENNTGKYDPNIDIYQRIYDDEFSADIHYLKNKSDVRTSEQKSKDIVEFSKNTKALKQNNRRNFKGVEVSAYASPEGALDLNTKLSEKRQNTSTKVVKGILSSSKASDIDVFSKFTPEDWDGFKELMEASTIQDKDLILRVLSMYSDPEVREKEIKNLGEAFTEVQDEILPKLRRSKITANFEVIGRTDEEIKAQFASDPSQLSPAELIYGAAISDNNDTKLAYYNALVKYYPEDWRGYNNIGVINAREGKYNQAKNYFAQAETKSNNQKVIKNNLAACAIVDKNFSEAEVLLGQASGAGNAVNYNSAIIAIKNNDYEKAAKLLTGTNTVNEALAKVMSGDADGALKALENTDCECWKVSYFKAIVAARMAKETSVYTNLKDVITSNPDAKELIATDIEFVQYFEKSEFKNIVK